MVFLLFCAAISRRCDGADIHARDGVTTVQPDPASTQGVWEGWGCSLAWWANQFGTRDDMADSLFTMHTVKLTTETGVYTLPALGLNVVRYNIGGTSRAGAFGAVADIPSGMPVFKQIQGFWLDWGSSDPNSASFNWNTDGNQRQMLLKARDRGADRFEAFSDTPMWWMCDNRSPAGSRDGGDNLQAGNYGQFAAYLAIVIRYAHDHWRIDFNSVEPFNEPSAYWWKYPGGQEGCHFSIAAQHETLTFLRAELDKRGLKRVGVSASDENSPDQALATWNALSDADRATVVRVNTHGYYGLDAYRGAKRGPLFQAVSSAGKKLWMTEYGESDGSGLTLAQSILLDLNQLRPTAWVYWQPFDSGGWGLVQCNPGDNWVGPPNPKYYVLAQFSRHIRPGMVLLGSGDPNTVAAYDRTAHTLTLVTLNGAAQQRFRYDLSRFRTVRGPITRWVTQPNGAEKYAQHDDTQLTSNAFEATFDPNTIQTFEVRNVFVSPH